MADTYTIVTQAPKVRAGLGGNFAHVLEVGFVTKPSGVYGVVDVPDTAFTPEEVDRAVRAKADLLERVQNL